jgi:DNA-directed RNA polymerase specialized sigma subunit
VALDVRAAATRAAVRRRVGNAVVLDGMMERHDRLREILRLRFAEDQTQAEVGAGLGVSQIIDPGQGRIKRRACARPG